MWEEKVKCPAALANESNARAAEIAVPNFSARLLVSAAIRNSISKPRTNVLGNQCFVSGAKYVRQKEIPTHAIA